MKYSGLLLVFFFMINCVEKEERNYDLSEVKGRWNICEVFQTPKKNQSVTFKMESICSYEDMVSLSKDFCEKNKQVFLVVDEVIYVPYHLVGYCNVLACGLERRGLKISVNKSNQVFVQEAESYILGEGFTVESGIRILEKYYDNMNFSGAIDFNFHDEMDTYDKIKYIRILMDAYTQLLNKRYDEVELGILKKKFPLFLYDANYILYEVEKHN